jgi:predicted enzyme related to lactoylglutathione lyase
MAITGIGGFFFRARDTAALAAWYETYFGIARVSNGPWQQDAGPTVFMPFAADTDYFPPDKQWMLNLRTDDLDSLLADLNAAGIEIFTDPSWNSPETGRFARVYDPEGNAIELWEPPPE